MSSFISMNLVFVLQELNDGTNFGLYLPPCNGRAGKFLDESRSLREYPLNGPVSYLEVMIYFFIMNHLLILFLCDFVSVQI